AHPEGAVDEEGPLVLQRGGQELDAAVEQDGDVTVRGADRRWCVRVGTGGLVAVGLVGLVVPFCGEVLAHGVGPVAWCGATRGPAPGPWSPAALPGAPPGTGEVVSGAAVGSGTGEVVPASGSGCSGAGEVASERLGRGETRDQAAVPPGHMTPGTTSSDCSAKASSVAAR